MKSDLDRLMQEAGLDALLIPARGHTTCPEAYRSAHLTSADRRAAVSSRSVCR
jgi:hypothetical protein